MTEDRESESNHEVRACNRCGEPLTQSEITRGWRACDRCRAEIRREERP